MSDKNYYIKVVAILTCGVIVAIGMVKIINLIGGY